MQLVPPFHWFGGKRRWAPIVNPELGKVDVYVEPFSGGLGILVSRKPARFETVGDIDGMVCNFWRAAGREPEKLAEYYDFPNVHHELTARRVWLRQWADKNMTRIVTDVDFYDVKAAGYWGWCLVRWLGKAEDLTNVGDVRDIVNHYDTDLGKLRDGMNVANSAQCIHGTKFRDGEEYDRLSLIDGSDMINYFTRLQRRMKKVSVINRPWESLVTPSVLLDLPSTGNLEIAVVLDPPYKITADGRKDRSYLYKGDVMANDTATDSYEWAREHGDRYKIVYFCHEGDFEIPREWTAKTLGFKRTKSTVRDMAMFSPRCAELTPKLF